MRTLRVLTFVASTFGVLTLFSCGSANPQTGSHSKDLLCNPISTNTCEPPLANWNICFDSLFALIRGSTAVIPNSLTVSSTKEVCLTRYDIYASDLYFQYHIRASHVDFLTDNMLMQLAEDGPMDSSKVVRDHINSFALSRTCLNTEECERLYTAFCEEAKAIGYETQIQNIIPPDRRRWRRNKNEKQNCFHYSGRAHRCGVSFTEIQIEIDTDSITISYRNRSEDDL